MNENLADMVRVATSDPTVPTEDEIVVEEDDIVEAVEAVEETVNNTTTKIHITNLLEWFKNNSNSFDNIKPVNVSIQDGEPTNLILSVENLEGRKNKNGNIMRIVQGFENADKIVVLDLPALTMNIFKNNNFKILYQTPIENIFVKCYSVSNGLIVIFNIMIEDMLIPYVIKRVKKKDTELDIILNTDNNLSEKINQNADLEALQLLYKQSVKSIDKFTTNKDVLLWLKERQAQILDINHLLQIDNLIIDILK